MKLHINVCVLQCVSPSFVTKKGSEFVRRNIYHELTNVGLKLRTC